jgi:hypothetical protein
MWAIQIQNNKVIDCGSICIAIQGNTNGSTNLAFVTVTGNQMLGPGTDGLATANPYGYAAVEIYSQTAGLTSRVNVSNNLAVDSNGNSGSYWLTGGGGASAANFTLANNTVSGFSNSAKSDIYPQFASLPTSGAGVTAQIIDGKASNCGDTTCTTFGTAVTGGGGALALNLFYNGSNWTLAGK